MRIPRWTVAVLAVLAIGLWAGKNILARLAVRSGVRLVTGLDASIRGLRVGVFTTSLGVQGLQVRNPAGFPDAVLMDAPEIYVDYDLGAAVKGDMHLEQVRLHLKELRVVKSADGRLNLRAIKGLDSERPAAPAGRHGAFVIDELALKIGTVVYTDYTVSPPSVRTFAVNLDERFTHITNPTAFAGLIVSQALVRTTVGQLANFDVSGLQAMVAQGLRGSAGLVTDAAAQTATQLRDGVGGTAKQAAGVATTAVGEVGGSLKKLFQR